MSYFEIDYAPLASGIVDTAVLRPFAQPGAGPEPVPEPVPVLVLVLVVGFGFLYGFSTSEKWKHQWSSAMMAK